MQIDANLAVDEGIVAKAMPISGWGAERDIMGFYEALVRAAPPGATVVEVGFFHGRSLAYLALAAKREAKGLNVVGVDWCRGQKGDVQGEAMADSVLRTLDRLDVLDHVTLLVNRSEAAAKVIADGSLWAVFIDDDHEEPLVRRSCEAWFPKVMPGGVFAGHDYHWGGVQKVVRESYPQHKVFAFEGTTNVWWLNKG